MSAIANASRVVLVVMDGLKASAIDALGLETLGSLTRKGAATVSAQTVRPSVTAAAMTSLFTGVSPETHGIAGDSFGVPPRISRLEPLPRVLARSSLPTAVFLAQIPFPHRLLVGRLSNVAGVSTVRFGATGAEEIVSVAAGELSARRSGLIIMHWPDADEAGHVHGWDSREYERGVRRMDSALGRLLEHLDGDDRTLVAVCSDHGGGGVVSTDHDSDHPDDRTIPIILAGGGATPTRLGSGVTLLDVPATILWALGLVVPRAYEGRPLVEAFAPRLLAA